MFLAAWAALAPAGQASAAPAPSVTLSAVTAAFYPESTSAVQFLAGPSDTPAFTQTFPVINFNPPTSVVPCSPGVLQIPFTDVLYNGSTCTDITAQGNGYQAGVGTLQGFDVYFKGTITALGSGNVTFNFYSDDGWILGVGPNGTQQPTYVSGSRAYAPPSSAFNAYPIMGAYNQPTAPVGEAVTVNFPAAGTYPFELDYFETELGALSFTVTANGSLIPPAPVVTAPAAQTVNEGQSHAFALGSFNDALAAVTTTGPWTADVNWGDGSAHTTFTETAVGSLGTQTHTYADNLPGNATYPATITVTNTASGLSGSASLPITVDNVPPTVTSAGGPASGTVGSPVSLRGTFTDPGVLDTHTATWNWGDSGTSPGAVTETAGSGSVAGNHTYSAAGTYTVTLTVTDKDGGTGSATTTVTIQSAQSLKQAAKTLLAPYASNHSVARAIDAITKSLTPSLWVDGMHLDPQHGQKVFDAEQQAVQALQQAMKQTGDEGHSGHSADGSNGTGHSGNKGHEDQGGDTPLSAAGITAAQSAIADLVQADHLIATTALADAQAAVAANPSHAAEAAHMVAEATGALAKGDAANAAGDAVRAIDQYRESWQQSRDALHQAAQPSGDHSGHDGNHG